MCMRKYCYKGRTGEKENGKRKESIYIPVRGSGVAEFTSARKNRSANRQKTAATIAPEMMIAANARIVGISCISRTPRIVRMRLQMQPIMEPTKGIQPKSIDGVTPSIRAFTVCM